MCNESKIRELKKEISKSNAENSYRESYFWELYRCAKNIAEDNRSSSISKAINFVFEMRKTLPEKVSAHRSLGWAIQKLLKSIEANEDLKKKYNSYISGLVRSLTGIRLNYAGEDHLLYVNLYRTLSKLANERSHWFINFAFNYGLEHFNEDDYASQISKNGKSYKGVAHLTLIKLGKIVYNISSPSSFALDNSDEFNISEINELNEKRRKAAAWLLPFIERAKDLTDDNIWLIYNSARLKFILGRNEESLAEIKETLKKKGEEPWAWRFTAEALKEKNYDEFFSALCFAKILTKNVKKLAPSMPVFTELAEELINRGEYSLAKSELLYLNKIRNENQFKPNKKTERLLQDEKIKSADDVSNDKVIAYCEHYAKQAEELYNNLFSEHYGIVENIANKDRTRMFVKFSKDESAMMNLKDATNFKIGDYVKIRVDEFVTNGVKKFKIKDIRKIESVKLDFVKAVQGTINIPKGKNFGFVENVFVSPALINRHNLRDSQTIGVLSVNSFNQNKSSYGFKAILVEPLDN